MSLVHHFKKSISFQLQRIPELSKRSLISEIKNNIFIHRQPFLHFLIATANIVRWILNHRKSMHRRMKFLCLLKNIFCRGFFYVVKVLWKREFYRTLHFLILKIFWWMSAYWWIAFENWKWINLNLIVIHFSFFCASL